MISATEAALPREVDQETPYTCIHLWDTGRILLHRCKEFEKLKKEMHVEMHLIERYVTYRRCIQVQKL